MRGNTSLIDALEPRRFLASIALDPSFGDAGKGTVAVNADLRGVILVRELSDSKILAIGGCTESEHSTGVALVRLNADGTIDTSFGIDGLVKTPLPFVPMTAAVQSDGQIIVAGQVGQELRLARVSATGVQDMTFAGDGVGEVTFDNTG